MKRSYYMRCPQCGSLVLWGVNVLKNNYSVMCDRDQCVMKGDIKEAANVLDALEQLNNKPTES